jgi:hypothetical protein
MARNRRRQSPFAVDRNPDTSYQMQGGRRGGGGVPGTTSGWGGYANWGTGLPVNIDPVLNPVQGGGGGGTVTPGPTGPSPEELAEQQRVTSAIDYIRRFFSTIGLEMDAELEGIITNAMKAGYTPADIESGILMPDIQKSQAFQRRFPGYNARISNGYNAINIRQYLELENSYRSIMESAGLPKGFYDDPSDMGQWIAKNTSPAEIEGRVRLAVDAAKSVDPTMRNLMARFYGLATGDVAAYFLDPDRALPAIEHQFNSANVASWAARSGYQINDISRYEQLVADGVTAQQAAAGYGTVRELNDAVGRVANVYGESYTQADAEGDVFFNKNEKRRRIMAQEAATFGGSSRGSTGSAQRSSY